MLLASFGTSSGNVSLPALQRAFDAAFQQVQWVVLAYLVALTGLVVAGGRLGDLWGRRRLLLWAIGVFVGASMLCSLAPTLWILVAARAAQGAGAAMMMTLSVALVGEQAEQAGMGRAMGLLGMLSSVGTALGPSLGGLLLASFGWRAIFLVNVVPGVFAILLLRNALRSDAVTGEMRDFDLKGAAMLGVVLALYAIAMTAARGRIEPTGLALLLAAAVGVALLVRIERRAAAPLLALALLRRPHLVGGLVMSALVSAVMMTMLVVGPYFLAGVYGLGPASTGLVLAAAPLAAALTAIPAGRLTDHLGGSATTIIGLVAAAAGCLVLSLAPARLGIIGYLAATAVLTSGYALFQTANNTMVMSEATARNRGLVSAMLTLSRNFGLITGASVMAAIFAAAVGHSRGALALPASVAGGAQATFALATGLIVAALAIAIRGQRRSAGLRPGVMPA
jgi:MFS family permease